MGPEPRELLTSIYNTLSFGELAVDGFFIVSGFLITASFHASRSPWDFAVKRVTRIYPAYVVMTLICLAIIAPIGGGIITGSTFHFFTNSVLRTLALATPAMPNAFHGTPYPIINGAAWTIQYEFACYVLVALLGSKGGLRSAAVPFAIYLACLIAFCLFKTEVSSIIDMPFLQGVVFNGSRVELLRFVAMFMIGASFYLCRDHIPISKTLFSIACVGLLMSLKSPLFSTIGVSLFGAYALYATASLSHQTVLSRINSKADISYGLYLYAWPIEKVLLWLGITSNPLSTGVTTFLLSLLAGGASWFCVEKPAKRAILRLIKRADSDAILLRKPASSLETNYSGSFRISDHGSSEQRA